MGNFDFFLMIIMSVILVPIFALGVGFIAFCISFTLSMAGFYIADKLGWL